MNENNQENKRPTATHLRRPGNESTESTRTAQRPQTTQRPTGGYSAGNRPTGARPGAVRTPGNRPVYAATNPAGNLPKNTGSTARKKSRKGQGLSTGVILAIILGIAAILIAITIIIVNTIGVKDIEYKFRDNTTGEDYSITFRGKLDELDKPLEGTIHLKDGSTAELVPLEEEGRYRITYGNGDVYEGALDQLQRTGVGSLKLANGDEYIGSFAYDRFDGKGVYTFATGDKYSGSFAAGVKSGEGEYTFADGSRYKGVFAADMRNGKGTYTYADGSVYEGNFVNDKKEDTSASMIIVRADGKKDRYVGAFVSDVRSGSGSYEWDYENDLHEVYVGEFKDNLLDGNGTYTWADGRSFTGHFTKGSIDAANGRYVEPTAEQQTGEQ